MTQVDSISSPELPESLIDTVCVCWFPYPFLCLAPASRPASRWEISREIFCRWYGKRAGC